MIIRKIPRRLLSLVIPLFAVLMAVVIGVTIGLTNLAIHDIDHSSTPTVIFAATLTIAIMIVAILLTVRSPDPEED